MTLPRYLRALWRRYWRAVREPLTDDVRDEHGL
jgi:hypothetical protein